MSICSTLQQHVDECVTEVEPTIISFIFILWICPGLQNSIGYGNSHICLSSQEVKLI